ncbi:DNA polymerase III subunit delta' [Spiribacter sp. 2438]|uniref:DNA polymerase III subunit delta' n=1 Tax=Spiribacter sp. 2438 TaxID=2666185 RepID=UPI0012B15258|nr:DNA polymerase III subunit delta' [Spiribacter sp. 2438]QGM21588.1 DNA polymerase III subunit delta' [Spiribacter sp. 2438]
MTEEATRSGPLPWQRQAWQRFIQTVVDGRVPHAILLAGPAGIGKTTLSHLMAAQLLCETPGATEPCGHCRGCHLRHAGSHPDARLLVPEEGGSGILKIEAIRQLVDFSQRTSQYSGYRVARLLPAEAMNRSAANALLKTLEEPPASVCLLLVSHQPSRLPATIRSRCQIFRLGVPPRAESLQWLKTQGIANAAEVLDLAGGAPFLARQLAEHQAVDQDQALLTALAGIVSGRVDATATAADWRETGARPLAVMMQRITLRVARAQAGSATPGAQPAITAIAKRLPPAALHALAGRLNRLRAASEQPLSRELSAEALFLLWRNSSAIQEVTDD